MRWSNRASRWSPLLGEMRQHKEGEVEELDLDERSTRKATMGNVKVKEKNDEPDEREAAWPMGNSPLVAASMTNRISDASFYWRFDDAIGGGPYPWLHEAEELEGGEGSWSGGDQVESVRHRRARILHGGSTWSAVLNATNTILGAGTLAIPFVLKCSGFLWGHVIFVVLLLLSNYSSGLLVEASALAGDLSIYKNYESLAYRTMGRPGVVAVVAAFLVGGFGLLMASLVFIAQSILSFWWGAPSEESFELKATVAGVAMVIIFPLCLVRKITKFRYSAFLSLVTILYLACFVVYSFIRHYMSTSALGIHPSLYHQRTSRLWLPERAELLPAVAIMVSAYSCHTSLLPVYEKLQTPTPSRMAYVIRMALILAFSVYEIVGLFGYSQFGDTTNENILNSYWSLGDNIFGVRLATLSIAVTLLTSCPMTVWPMRSCIVSLIFMFTRKPSIDNEEEDDLSSSPLGFSNTSWVTSTFFIIALTTLLAVLFPQVKVALTVVGSVGGSFIVFIFPALFWLLLQDGSKRKWRYLPAYGLLLGGVLLGFSSFCVTLQHVFCSS